MVHKAKLIFANSSPRPTNLEVFYTVESGETPSVEVKSWTLCVWFEEDWSVPAWVRTLVQDSMTRVPSDLVMRFATGYEVPCNVSSIEDLVDTGTILVSSTDRSRGYLSDDAMVAGERGYAEDALRAFLGACVSGEESDAREIMSPNVRGVANGGDLFERLHSSLLGRTDSGAQLRVDSYSAAARDIRGYRHSAIQMQGVLSSPGVSTRVLAVMVKYDGAWLVDACALEAKM